MMAPLDQLPLPPQRVWQCRALTISRMDRSLGFQCRHCKVVFGQLDGVMRHIEEMHPQVDIDAEPQPCRAPIVSPNNGTGKVKISLEPPTSFAADSLCRARCPICRQQHDLKALLHHLNTVHPETDADHNRTVLKERYAQYEMVLAAQRQGVPAASRGPAPSAPGSLPPAPPQQNHRAPPTSSPSSLLGGDDYRCEVCGKPHDSEMSLLDHMEADHADVMSGDVAAPATPLRKEPPKPRGNPNIRVPESDINIHQPIAVVCLACGHETRTYRTIRLLSEHLLVTHRWEDTLTKAQKIYREHQTILRDGTQPSFSCLQCPRQFFTKEAMDEHFEVKHRVTKAEPTGPRPPNWFCEECQKGWKDAKGLYTHKVSRHGWKEQKTPCPICRKKYNDAYSMLEHLMAAHKTADPKQFHPETWECEDCPKKFIDADSYDDHVTKSHKNRSHGKPGFLR